MTGESLSSSSADDLGGEMAQFADEVAELAELSLPAAVETLNLVDPLPTSEKEGK